MALTVHSHLVGAREAIAVLDVLPKDAEVQLKNASEQISRYIAGVARGDAVSGGGPQGSLLAPTVKAVRGRTPMVQVGGTKRVGRRRAPAYGVLYGSVFGANGRYGWYGRPRYRPASGRQYRPHAGRAAYWFFPLLESQSPAIGRWFNRAADKVVNDWTEGV